MAKTKLIQNPPSFELEYSFQGKVIGVDEAGRGPLAGPVVAAAIIIDEKAINIGINDSKKLSHSKREQLFSFLTNNYTFGIGIVDAQKIDEINILQATFLAMKEAISQIPDFANTNILVDGNKPPYNSPNIHPIVKGDQKSLSIAAASIIAKVTRDRIMQDLHSKYPYYGWDTNAGYGTNNHISAIKQHNITIFHRKTFLNNIL
jgi:ribonuclease HII